MTRYILYQCQYSLFFIQSYPLTDGGIRHNLIHPKDKFRNRLHTLRENGNDACVKGKAYQLPGRCVSVAYT